MAAPAHYIRSIHTSFTNAPHSLVAPRSASSAWSTTTTQQSAYGGYTQPRRSSAGPKASLTSGYTAGYNALGATAGSNGGAIMNTHNTHSYTHHLQNPAAHAQGQGYQGQTQRGRRVQEQQQQQGQRGAGVQGGRRRSVSIRMPPTYSYSSANPSALAASSQQPSRPVSPSQLSAAAPVFTPRQALIQEATSMATAATSAPTRTSSPAVTPVTMVKKEKPTYKFDPFADDDADGDVSMSASVSSADALTSAFGPYELQTIHIPPAAPRDIARYSSPSRSPSPPSTSLAAPEPEHLSAPPPTPKLSAAPLPPTTASEPLLTSDPFSTTQSYSQSSAPTTIVNRPRDDYLARIVAGLLLQRQMSGRPRRRAVYASGCGGVGMYRKSRLSAGWVGAGIGEA
ncbi:hypothetical protein D9619_012081 [Psilocybe cf. subviscida]|uniref:Uncharacterized protein n=1 Tax=Psilocybe cf. subviscida TaxID=2480587 RepID=A0A8H5B888_9AGAR|nr:hypothetical protein D9619_012081 [Psilocybe cf. subviscida]